MKRKGAPSERIVNNLFIGMKFIPKEQVLRFKIGYPETINLVKSVISHESLLTYNNTVLLIGFASSGTENGTG